MKFLAGGVLGAVLGASLLGLAGCSQAATGGGGSGQNAPISANGYTTVTVPLPNGQGSVLCVTTYQEDAMSCDFSTRVRR